MKITIKDNPVCVIGRATEHEKSTVIEISTNELHDLFGLGKFGIAS